MAEPASESVSGAISAGGLAATLSYFGLEGAPLFWALIGSCIGVSFAVTDTSRLRTSLVFVCVVFSCSLIGVWVADSYFSSSPVSKNFFSCIFAVVFHPVLNAVVTKLPKLLDGLIRKYTGGQ